MVRNTSAHFGFEVPQQLRDLQLCDVEARMIEHEVQARIGEMAVRLRSEIEREHLHAIETFVRNIQQKLILRMTALEEAVNRQAAATREIGENCRRTDDNLIRLNSGIEELTSTLR